MNANLKMEGTDFRRNTAVLWALIRGLLAYGPFGTIGLKFHAKCPISGKAATRSDHFESTR